MPLNISSDSSPYRLRRKEGSSPGQVGKNGTHSNFIQQIIVESSIRKWTPITAIEVYSC
ncbi:MAG: hypothetical protein KZQ91_17960 [Candidatus Thiodiazotropha sp. (ex Lucinoma borealis)]|nr:hypothetical protein [Candidatus Thiodiazotropha sp. (ex Lucinoma borealis)]